MKNHPVCNITMLVRDRFALTKQALESLDRSLGAGHYSCNTTILDDRSGEETKELLNTWKNGHHALIVRNYAPIGTGEARNLVIKAAREHWTIPYQFGDYLYLSDNDVFFKPGWLEALIACYEDVWSRGFRVLGAYNHPYHQAAGEMQFISNRPELRVYEVNALALQSMLMRWEVWDKYGPFCDTPVDKVCQSEDVDFTNKIHADGFKIGVVSPALIVSTGITNTFGEKIPGWELVKAQCPAGVIIE